jgi:hypothetical protein
MHVVEQLPMSEIVRYAAIHRYEAKKAEKEAAKKAGTK